MISTPSWRPEVIGANLKELIRLIAEQAEIAAFDALRRAYVDMEAAPDNDFRHVAYLKALLVWIKINRAIRESF